jgi:hypothetical protein
MSAATKARDERIAERTKTARSMSEIWVICAGNSGRFPYYQGHYSPLAACWEDASMFPTREAAQSFLDRFGCPGAGCPQVIRVK